MNAAAFDRIAATYDARWTDTPAGRAQRDETCRYPDRLFRVGVAILDICCGPSDDALHLGPEEIADLEPAEVEA
jgi:hypothetical protein